MRKNLTFKLAAVVLGLTLVGAACSDDSDDSASEDGSTTTEQMADETTTTAADDGASEEAGTIVDVAAGNEDFSTLVDLVTAAGLAETLSGEGPFTVFAPDDDAFAKVDAATLEQLQADPTGALAEVLQLHVISGEVMAADAAGLVDQCADTVGGGKVKITQEGEDLYFGGAKIIATDIEASNGVIHVIDTPVTAASTDC